MAQSRSRPQPVQAVVHDGGQRRIRDQRLLAEQERGLLRVLQRRRQVRPVAQPVAVGPRHQPRCPACAPRGSRGRAGCGSGRRRSLPWATTPIVVSATSPARVRRASRQGGKQPGGGRARAQWRRGSSRGTAARNGSGAARKSRRAATPARAVNATPRARDPPPRPHSSAPRARRYRRDQQPSAEAVAPQPRGVARLEVVHEQRGPAAAEPGQPVVSEESPAGRRAAPRARRRSRRQGPGRRETRSGHAAGRGVTRSAVRRRGAHGQLQPRPRGRERQPHARWGSSSW